MDAWTFEAIGTQWHIDTDEPVPPAVRESVMARIDAFDRDWSRFRNDSFVSRVAAQPGEHPLPEDAADLFSLYDALDDLTGGAVNPLAGAALVALGYDAQYSLVPSGPPVAAAPWSSVQRSETHLVTVGELIDVGAAGKGRLVDLVSATLSDRGVEAHTVDAGGDLVHRADTALRVGLEHPADPTRAIGIAELADGRALCGSATNRRAWGEGLHHVVDARTGTPTADVAAVWVVADTCMLADGLATAHFFTTPDELMARFDHQFVRMHADGRVLWSPEFPGEVFA